MRIKTMAIGVAALTLLLSLLWSAAGWYERTLIEKRRLQVLAELTPYGNALTTAINRSLWNPPGRWRRSFTSIMSGRMVPAIRAA